MFRSTYRSWAIFIFSTAVLTTALLGTSEAAFIDTQAAMEVDDRAERIAHINVMLEREDVRAALIGRGVSPDDATARVQNMTDAELRMVAQQLDQLPAGGDLIGVVGIVAIVLVILELLDVTDLFTAF